ncbi:hypothetical protein [Ferrovibrio terrae]|uniref:hypothetical protein n=1 Tax=Ferrovibrio terrae TaxID=2594003 RepID=UPI003137B44E
MTSPLDMTYWTWQQTAEQFGGRSAQWLRRQIATNPDFIDFPKAVLGGNFIRVADFLAWDRRQSCEADMPRAGKSEQQAVEDELMRRAQQ